MAVPTQTVKASGSSSAVAYQFVIVGKPRSAKNSKQIVWYKDRRTQRQTAALVDDPKVKKWRKAAVKQLQGQWVGREPLEGCLGVIVVSYLGKRQRGDADNLLAGPLDALEKAGIVRNDSIFEMAISIRRYDPDNPRCEILIHPIELLHIMLTDQKESWHVATA
jgi:Holliday junction resolvase RusA-like endonuclease